MGCKLLILDCDGVLVDSEKLGNRVLAEAMREYGLSISEADAYDRFRGMKLGACLDILERESGHDFPANMEAVLRRRMSRVFAAQLQPVAGARDFVESLKIPFCVASSGPRQKIEENLKTTKLYEHFRDRIFSAHEVGAWKPDPGLFLAAADQLGASAAECIVVEDSPVGVAAALAADMTVFALDPLMQDKSLQVATRVFASLAQIRGHLAAHGLASS